MSPRINLVIRSIMRAHSAGRRKSKMARRTTNRKHQGNVLKQAWEWTDHTEPEKITSENIESVYLVNTTVCSQGDCRRNCKANPNCFNCLGERFWLGEIKDNYWLTCEDPENERRPESAFVGLKNLGATCYVNTFLQVWFHNPVFRSAMYKYISPAIPECKSTPDDNILTVNGLPTSESESKPADSSKMTNHKEENGEALNKPSVKAVTPVKVSAVEQVPLLPSTTVLNSDEAPTTVCGHLQLLFAQLQYSFRRYIDPSPFVDSLGLDTAQQQDAQEFSKLFTSLLEETLSKQAEPEVQNIVQSQFGGEYFYVTECYRCGNKSKRLSRFYELDLNIQGHTALNQCIKEFLKEEKLDGDNQYYCTQCNSKQNAARYIELHSLPPVLNLQLLRFVFDRRTGYKKKLNSFIQFPDILDMRDHVKDGCIGSDAVYELSAVLIHFGVSAYSGHYVAHIRDKKSGSWYKFNDEDIVKMQGKLKLSQDEDSADTNTKPAKRPKCAKGYHVSKNAYTLVYTLQGHKGVGSEDDDDIEVPSHVQELVAMDNSRFEDWVRQVKEFREKLLAKGQKKQAEIRKLYQDMPVTSETEYEWISTKWLKDWMNDKTETPPVDNSSLLCSHGKLNPNQVVNAKRINIKVADEIFRKYGGLPRLQSDSLCINCVKEQCRRIRFESRLAEDYKFVSDTLKNQTSKTNCEKFFWVGRRSLLRWKALANYYEQTRQSLMDSCQVTANHDVEDEDEANASRNENNDVSMTEENGTEQLDKNEKENGAEESEDDNDSKFNEDLLCEHGDLSSDESCRRLVPDVVWQRLKYYFPSSPEFEASHAVCRSCQEEDEEERLKNETYKLLASEQRAAVSQLYLDRNRPSFENNDPFVVCVISKEFLDHWRQFLRFPIKNVPPKSIVNAPLLCPHEKFLFNPECEDDMDGASKELCYVWQPEWNTLTQTYLYDHMISVTKTVTEDEARELVTSPEVCTECCCARIQERAQHIENYRYGTIFVRKITKDHSEKDIQQALNDSTSSKDGDSFDPDFQTPPDSKKPKLNRDSRARRSSRHRKQRGEVSLTVGSTETLRDVKLQLMKSFSVMPMDQHITLNGVPLTDNEATLISLGIKPGSLLLLKIDEPQGAISQDALPVSNAPEEGFKGTGLLGHS